MIDRESTEPNNVELQAVAERLRIAREHAGLSQQAFAERLGYSRRQITAWEAGANAPPIWALSVLRREYNIDPEWILSGPGWVPLSDVAPQGSERAQRLRREVTELAREYGLLLSSQQLDNLASLLLNEQPSSEKEAKAFMRRMFQALAAGNKV